VRREDLQRIAVAVEAFGLLYRRVEGVDMLVQRGEPSVRRAVHMVFTGEKMSPEYSETVPDLGEPRVLQGVRLIDLADLIRMKPYQRSDAHQRSG
jgi:hypothetical protein